MDLKIPPGFNYKNINHIIRCFIFLQAVPGDQNEEALLVTLSEDQDNEYFDIVKKYKSNHFMYIPRSAIMKFNTPDIFQNSIFIRVPDGGTIREKEIFEEICNKYLSKKE